LIHQLENERRIAGIEPANTQPFGLCDVQL